MWKTISGLPDLLRETNSLLRELIQALTTQPAQTAKARPPLPTRTYSAADVYSPRKPRGPRKKRRKQPAHRVLYGPHGRSLVTDEQILAALDTTNGNSTKAAKILGVSYQLVQKRKKSIAIKSAAGVAVPSPHADVHRTEAEKMRDKLLKHRERFTGSRNLVTIPGVQSLDVAIRYLDGGRDRWLELVQNAVLHNNPEAEKWWFVFCDLTQRERRDVSYTDVCAAAGVKPSALVGACASIEMEFGRDVADLVRFAALPRAMSVLVKSAMNQHTEIGERDRTRLLQSANILPTPKGTVIQVAANAQAAASAALDQSVPSFAGDMESLQPVRVTRVLPPQNGDE